MEGVSGKMCNIAILKLTPNPHPPPGVFEIINTCQELKLMMAKVEIFEQETQPGSPKNAVGGDDAVGGRAPEPPAQEMAPSPKAYEELIALTLAQSDSDAEHDSLAVEDPYAMPVAVEDPYAMPVAVQDPYAMPEEAESDPAPSVERPSVDWVEVADKKVGLEAPRPVATPQRGVHEGVESDLPAASCSGKATRSVGPAANPSPTAPSECLSATDTSPATPATDIPDEDDSQASRPEAGALRLSKEAIDMRLRRIMTPNSKGEYQVSPEVLKRYHSKKGKGTLRQLFQSCGWDKERMRTHSNTKVL